MRLTATFCYEQIGLNLAKVTSLIIAINVISRKENGTMFENKKVKATGIHYNRYIESWRNEGGYIEYGEAFDEWLTFEGLTEDEIRDVHDLCTGKFELEVNCKPFIEKQKKAIEELEKEAELEEKRKAKIDPKAAKLVRNRVRNHFNEAVNYIKNHADEIIGNAAK